jgi:hypothetical protein
MFVEQILPGAMLRKLTEEEMTEYRRPFVEPGEGRRPTLTWPRQIPINVEPADVDEIIRSYGEWLSESSVPKLFIKGEPGALLASRPPLEFCRSWPSQAAHAYRHQLVPAHDQRGLSSGRNERERAGCLIRRCGTGGGAGDAGAPQLLTSDRHRACHWRGLCHSRHDGIALARSPSSLKAWHSRTTFPLLASARCCRSARLHFRAGRQASSNCC